MPANALAPNGTRPPAGIVVIINPLCAKFIRTNINICLQFLSFFYSDVTQVVEIWLFCIVSVMGADALAMQGARASVAMLLVLVKLG